MGRSGTGELAVTLLAVAVRLLEETQTLLGTRGAWTQRAAARTARSKSVAYDDPSAVRWCLASAIALVAKRLREREAPTGSEAAMLSCAWAAFGVVLDPLADQHGFAVSWRQTPGNTVALFAHTDDEPASAEITLEQALIAFNDFRLTRYRHVRQALEQAIKRLEPYRSQLPLTALLARLTAATAREGGRRREV